MLTLLLIPAIIALVPVPFRHAREGTIHFRNQLDEDLDEVNESSLRE